MVLWEWSRSCPVDRETHVAFVAALDAATASAGPSTGGGGERWCVYIEPASCAFARWLEWTELAEHDDADRIRWPVDVADPPRFAAELDARVEGMSRCWASQPTPDWWR